MRTPDFWRKKNLLSVILLPLSLIYWLIFRLLWALGKESEFAIKVVCVGNLTAGGAGKTPAAIASGKILRAKKVNFAYLSSGYKGDDVEFCEVLINSDSKKVGDEPILLSEIAPTFVARDRRQGVRKIEELGYDLVILDDGMQDKSIKKDFTFVVIDGKTKFGNEMLIPAGPLRQTIKSGLKMANRIVAVGGMDEGLIRIIGGCKALDKVIVAAVGATDVDDFKGREIFAFCGLGYPEKFFSFLDDLNLNIVRKKSFADHYSYKDSDLDLLIEESMQAGSLLLTTKKDWVRFDEKYRQKIDFLGINFTFKEEGVIVRDIEKITNK